ncbi:MAG: alpha/beta hydrolase [Paracoccaceae bacterium]|nr:alpha/beta hydrolase [Paracoccaceae bacterium]
MLIEILNGYISAHTRSSGRPFLVLHGGGLDHRHMVDAIEPVFQENSDWERFYIDLPGHRDSKVDASIHSQVDVLKMVSQFADLTFNGDRFAVIGESRGSYRAMGLAHTRPDFLLGTMLIVADAMPESTAIWRPKHQTLVSAPHKISKKSPTKRRGALRKTGCSERRYSGEAPADKNTGC